MTALFGPADHARLDALRAAHYPSDRNRTEAHLTLFRHLPPSIEAEVKARLAEETRSAPPAATIAGILDLGGGTAFRIESPAIEAMRARLADALHGLLTPQDAAGWRPHITIQNKVTAEAARSLQRSLARDFEPRPLAIAGLASWRYLGGPWALLSRHSFRG